MVRTSIYCTNIDCSPHTHHIHLHSLARWKRKFMRAKFFFQLLRFAMGKKESQKEVFGHYHYNMNFLVHWMNKYCCDVETSHEYQSNDAQ